MTRLRRLIAQRMVESLQTSAQLTTVVEVDVTKIARLRERAKRDFETREGVKLSFLPFFMLAAVEALKNHPVVNASVEGDQITYHAQENLGIAVDTDKGLLVPVVRDAGDLNIAGLARKVGDRFNVTVVTAAAIVRATKGSSGSGASPSLPHTSTSGSFSGRLPGQAAGGYVSSSRRT